MVQQGDKQGVTEYFDKLFMAFWDGNIPQNEVPRPWVDRIMVDEKWRRYTFPISLRFDDAAVKAYPRYKADLKQMYTFSFLADTIPNPRAIFHINGSGSHGFGDAEDGEDDEEADVKHSYNVWNEDWHR